MKVDCESETSLMQQPHKFCLLEKNTHAYIWGPLRPLLLANATIIYGQYSSCPLKTNIKGQVL